MLSTSINMCDYNKLINSIKLKTKILLGAILALEILLFFLLPTIIYFIIVSLLVFCAYLLAMSKIYSPIQDALENECDPEKFKQLFFSDANKKASGVSVLSANFNISYLTGDFDTAIDYANQMIADGRFNAVISGLSNKAIAEFFKGDYNSLKETVEKYHKKVADATHLKRNELQLYINNEKRLCLYVAIADNDTEQVKTLSQQLKITNNTTLSRVQISFLKAVSSYIIKDVNAVKEHSDYVNKYGSKTIYSSSLSKFIIF